MLLILVLVAAMGLGVVYMLPSTVAKLTYAVEAGKSQAAQEKLASAEDLSAAFKYVAQSLRPSVVSISSVKRIKPVARNDRGRSTPFGQGSPLGSDMPEEFRRFFGDDFFDRFEFDLPQPPKGYEQHGTGSGFIVSEDGYILTANHVVDGADEVTVRLSDNRELAANIVGTDRHTDLAVLKVDAKGLVPAQLGDSSKMEVGDWVVAVGSPFGLDQTVTAGIVSAKGRANVGINDYEDFLQTDAAINPGNSGGPLVNLHGEVIGVNTAIASRNGGNMGVGFAIPSNMAKSVMESLIAHGQVERGWLGAAIQDLSPELAASFGYEGTEGVLIGDVVANGPAAKAGLKSGDIVAQFDGKAVKDANELRNAVAATASNTNVPVEVFRDGKRQVLTVHIGNLDEDSLAAAGSESGSRGGDRGNVQSNDLGITVQTLTADLARQLGYDESAQGAVVTNVESGSAAASLGIQPGDVIVAVGHTTIDSAAAFSRAMEGQDLAKGVRMQIMRDNVRRFMFVKIS